MERVKQFGVVLLVLLVVASALGVVWTRHRNRVLFMELSALQKQRDALGIEFGRLEIEQATWAEPGRVETIAREQFGMIDPPAPRIRLLRR